MRSVVGISGLQTGEDVNILWVATATLGVNLAPDLAMALIV